MKTKGYEVIQMQFELNRLASFDEYDQQESGNLSCLSLARSGYFYDGRQPACFQCRVPLPREESITAGNLDEVHRRLSSNCSQAETNNVPLTQPRSPTTESDCISQPEEPISVVYRQALERAKSRGIFTSGSQTGRENSDREQFRDEAARLTSFRDWPQGAHIQPEALASAGFFYTGEGDRVCCAFCGGVLSGWEPGDDPTVEHDRHYADRNCPFQRRHRQDLHGEQGQGHVSTVYRNDQVTPSLPSTQRGRPAWSELTTATGSESSTGKLTLLTAEQSRRDHPKHPEFTDQLQRFQTYPFGAFRTGQRAETLAQAGFFYEGPEDRVRCFHCAGLLKNWTPTDVPINEHERWFPSCQFLQSLKNNASLQNTSRQMQSSASSVGLTDRPFISASVFNVEPREIKARMDSASVVALLQMGFSRTLIRQVIEIRLRTTGDDFPSAESLLEAVFDLQEQMSLEPSGIPHDSGNGEPAAAAHLTSSTASNVIAASDKRITVQQTAPVNQIPHQMTRISDTSSSINLSRDAPASGTVSSSSNSEPVKLKNKTRRKQKKHSQTRARDPDDLTKAAESINEVKRNDVGGSMDTNDENEATRGEEAEGIAQENRQLREARSCKICLDAEVSIVFLPCGHLVCCHSCSSALKVCPMCRVLIRGTVRVFLP